MQQYPIGEPGKPWGNAEKQKWLSAQTIKRSYQQEVVSKLANVPEQFEKFDYGQLQYGTLTYQLIAFANKHYNSDNPTVLITGGVHGYETSGVQGAIRFLVNHASEYTSAYNFIIAPCVCPWGYETINRWNPNTIDPNRSFRPDSEADEPRLLMDFLDKFSRKIDVHFDLHETTDTDDTEFRPALAAKNGIEFNDWGIPDGFYTVADTARPKLEFQKAIIDAVSTVTHIAPADERGCLIGVEVVSEGVICYDKRALFLCGGFTDAEYVTTTEVYPDSEKATPEQCINAQVAAIQGGLGFISKAG